MKFLVADTEFAHSSMSNPHWMDSKDKAHEDALRATNKNQIPYDYTLWVKFENGLIQRYTEAYRDGLIND